MLKPVTELLAVTRPNTSYTAEATLLDWACNSHALKSTSPTLALWGITQWAADAGWPKITLQRSHPSYAEQVQYCCLRFGNARNRQRYMEKCLRRWSEHTASGVRSSSCSFCRSTLPQAPAAQLNSNWSQMSAVQPSGCLRVWPVQPPSFLTLLAA